MSGMDHELAAARWDAEYRRGRYAGEPPVPFVEQILGALQDRRARLDGPGLYVGCGNGRNYLPLVDAGLDLYGLDLSPAALQTLAARRPAVAGRLICGDFRRFGSARPFSCLVAIQVFQHGTDADVAIYFGNVAALLAKGGLFFLRVNSVATQPFHRHTVIERNDRGGFTALYEEGPKRGLPMHFYSRDELHALTREAFRPVAEPREDVILRSPPKTGSRAQWEMIWERRSG